MSTRKILLVEPPYKAKYPPLGLMKISTYHKLRGDQVVFAKGCIPELRMETWDRVYVSTLFTYYWKETLRAIDYYQKCVPRRADVFVGGIMATLLESELRDATGATIIAGLIDKPGMLDPEDKVKVDTLTPDYGILSEGDHQYELGDCYIGYATRGCPRRCGFCAVHRVEPRYAEYLPLRRQVQLIEELYGPKRDLILLDNNVLASDRFGEIIADIKALGFERGATFSYKNKAGRTSQVKRYVDFNQGLDSRLLTEDKVALLAEVAIRPVRIAFDDIGHRSIYEEKVRLAAKYDLKYLSNYILYNYIDHPDDLYERLKINVDLNEGLGLQIFSFPMRYIGLSSKDRLWSTPGNLGKHWNRKFLRAIQCILVRTRGVVGTRKPYFLKAFGENRDEFNKILLMPEDYIIHRFEHEGNGSTEKWWQDVCSLSGSERTSFLSIVLNHGFQRTGYSHLPCKVRAALAHYIDRDSHLQMSLWGASNDPTVGELEENPDAAYAALS